jgi:hypothetical protein
VKVTPWPYTDGFRDEAPGAARPAFVMANTNTSLPSTSSRATVTSPNAASEPGSHFAGSVWPSSEHSPLAGAVSISRADWGGCRGSRDNGRRA